MKKQVKKLALKHAFFYVTLDPERALGVEDILPNYTIICPYKSWLTDELKEKKIKTFVLEKELGLAEAEKIAEKGSYGILQSEGVIKFIRNSSGSDPDELRINILVLKTSSLIEDLCKKQGWNLLAPRVELAEKYENKISQYEALKDIVPYPKSYLSTLSEVYERRLEPSFVLQFNRGHSGNSTFFINSKEDLRKLYNVYPRREVKISEFIEGTPYTLNCLVLGSGKTITGSLSEQITGIKEATNNPNTTVGNDWGSPRNLSAVILSSISDIAQEIGGVLYKEGYRGFFGIDVVMENRTGKVYFIELNTHQPASISFEAKIHRRIGRVPLFAYFIFDSAGVLNDISEENLPPFILPINAKQVIYRNKKSRRLNRKELFQKYGDKKFISRMNMVKPNEEVWREQTID